MTETVSWLIRVHWHVQHLSGVVGGEDAGDRTGQGAPLGVYGRELKATHKGYIYAQTLTLDPLRTQTEPSSS